MLTIYKKLNVSPDSYPLVIPIKQYSSDFALKFKLYSTDGDLDIEEGATTKIRGTKRDGNGFELTGTRIGNTCTFSGTKAQMQQMTAAHGRCVFEIVVEKNTKELITANFYLEVQRAAMDAGTVTSESIIEEFADFQSKITAAQAAATAAQEQADRAEVAAESVGKPTDEQAQNAVDNWLDEHPEATTTVQDGAVTTAKLAGGSVTESKLADNIYLDKYRNFSAVYDTNILLSSIGIDSEDTYTMQGACYNSTDKRILIAFHQAYNSDCIVKELDENWNVLRTVTLTLYHANDITFNHTTGKYYVADGENNNIIYVVDANTLSITDTIILGVNAKIAQISYDAINNRYYFVASNKIYTCDSAFGNIMYYADIDTFNDYNNIRSISACGSCMIGETFVSQWWIYSEAEQPTSYTRLYFANADKNYQNYYFDFRSQLVGDEAEALLPFENKIVSIGYFRDSITRVNIHTKGTATSSGMICLIGNTYTSFNRIPINSYGTCVLPAAISPTGSDVSGSYICYGTGDLKTIHFTVNDVEYTIYKVGTTWSSWHSNKDILNSLIINETLIIATGQTISAGASSPEYVVEVPAINGYIPFAVIHRQVTAPVVFPWYMYLATDSTKESGYSVKCRYRNTGAEQTNQRMTVAVLYVRTT